LGARALLFGCRRRSSPWSQVYDCNYGEHDECWNTDGERAAFNKDCSAGCVDGLRTGWNIFETGFDLGERASTRRVDPETLLSNIGEGLWNRCRHNRLRIC